MTCARVCFTSFWLKGGVVEYPLPDKSVTVDKFAERCSSRKVVINEASKKQKTKHKHSLTDTATTLAHTEYSKLVVTRRTHASRLVS